MLNEVLQWIAIAFLVYCVIKLSAHKHFYERINGDKSLTSSPQIPVKDDTYGWSESPH